MYVKITFQHGRRQDYFRKAPELGASFCTLERKFLSRVQLDALELLQGERNQPQGVLVHPLARPAVMCIGKFSVNLRKAKTTKANKKDNTLCVLSAS